MTSKILLSVLALLAVGTTAYPADFVEFELIVRQKPAGIDKYFEIRRDTLDLYENSRVFTFMVNFGLDMIYEQSNSQMVEFTAHLTTIGKSPHAVSERFRIEYDLPGRIENIPGKNGSVYQLLISPRRKVSLDREDCPYFPGDDGGFISDPTPNFDIYYVKGSLGDLRWNNIKAYLENDYILFRDALKINIPGKINYYLSPCTMEEINWDDRFGYMIDPGRSRAFAIYNHDFSSAEAVLTNIVRLMRSWGYAPPFLVEGLAGYFEFINFRTKNASPEQLLHPGDILSGENYYAADPIAAEITASSFIKFLADSYGIDKVHKLYEASDDLTLPLQIKPIYEKSLDTLEAEWRKYIDTVSLNRQQFQYYAGRAALIMQSDKQIEYLEQMQAYDSTRADTLATLKDLNTAYYQGGRYYEAIEGYRELIKLDKDNPVNWQVLGNLKMINGEYDEASELFAQVFALDSTYASAKLRQAQIEAIRGDTAEAIKTAEKYYGIETATPAKIEFLLFLGRMYGTRGSNFDSTRSTRSYQDALAWITDVLNRAPHDPSYQLRAGQAYLGLNKLEEAERYLEQAYFSETRSFNIGKILLYLGKMYDLKGDREYAGEFYNAVITNHSAVWHRDEARRYLGEPFRN